jgi:hypothetical protein
MSNNKQFIITLSERQLRLLAYACRVTDRLIIGQLNFSLQECCEAAFEKLYKGKEAGKVGSDEWYAMRFEVEEAKANIIDDVISKIRDVAPAIAIIEQ